MSQKIICDRCKKDIQVGLLEVSGGRVEMAMQTYPTERDKRAANYIGVLWEVDICVSCYEDFRKFMVTPIYNGDMEPTRRLEEKGNWLRFHNTK